MSIYLWTARAMFRVSAVRLRTWTVWSSWWLQSVAIHSLESYINLTYIVSPRNSSSTYLPSGQSRRLSTTRNTWIQWKYVWNIPPTVQRGCARLQVHARSQLGCFGDKPGWKFDYLSDSSAWHFSHRRGFKRFIRTCRRCLRKHGRACLTDFLNCKPRNKVWMSFLTSIMGGKSHLTANLLEELWIILNSFV